MRSGNHLISVHGGHPAGLLETLRNQADLRPETGT